MTDTERTERLARIEAVYPAAAAEARGHDLALHRGHIPTTARPGPLVAGCEACNSPEAIAERRARAPRRLIPSGRTPAAIIRDHVPSLTAKAERMLDELGPIEDYADAAIRECPCGLMLDGFYAYADHLADVLTRELLGEPGPVITGALG